ncbi:alpha/beta hydrolase [Amycolatopsis balhimycina DSM 5908]|uniref:Alpha/beta hydrolase n=1 Tax=Amycolatopsis balhimycina DSM 5908 TaxID=1081091 RepID=A0A428VY25_AMYBA|nr:alpha/beta hydrolase [Amycolatopsis balhimycina]RSM35708.1 alpha/beta hydrolase [Amycolatopsis balhimycina DSM 5908]
MTTYTADTLENHTVAGPSAVFTYRRTGPRGGVPLVLLMRFRGTIDWWDPEFVDHLAADRDVIIFDNVGIGYTGGEPRDTAEGFADGAIEFIEALGLTQADLLGWSLGGIVAQLVALRRPGLVRKVVVAGSSGPGLAPGTPGMDERVLSIMAKPDADAEDLLYLFYPETGPARAAGLEHLEKVAKRLEAGGPPVTEEAAQGQLAAVGRLLAVDWDQLKAQLQAISQPVLYANGIHDVMISALGSYKAVEQVPDSTLILYSDAGHAFLFQHIHEFAAQVDLFLAH